MENEQVKKELIYAGSKIDECITHRIFTIEELQEFLKKDVYEVFSYGIKELKDYKTRLLYNIYLKPFELYYSKYFEKYLLDDAIDLIKERYAFETSYLDSKFQNREIGKLEYENMIDKLDMYYIYSSNYGKGILRKYIR